MSNPKKVPKQDNSKTKDFWISEITVAEHNMTRFHERSKELQKRYRSDNCENFKGFDSNYNIFYSNTETIRPILINEPANIDVRAVNDSVMASRQAAKILEDSLNYNANLPETFNSFKKSVKDYLISGLGVVRVKYVPTYEKKDEVENNIDLNGELTEKITVNEKLVFEEIEYQYVHCDDLLFPDCTEWKHLPWIGFKGYYTYEEVKKDFGVKVANAIKYEQFDQKDLNNKYKVGGDSNNFALALIYEIWDKTNKKVIFVCKDGGSNEPLKVVNDPLELDCFYPIAEPLRSITTNNTLYPVPFFVQYYDLAEELNEVSTRIRNNVNSLKRRGVYDSSIPELQNLPSKGDNVFIAVKDLLDRTGGQGLQSIMPSEDLTQQLAVLQTLYNQRQEIIQAIYQITGYSDILRGQTDPRETLGAQKMKGRYSTLRISEQQREVQRFIRDTYRLAGEIIVNKFEPKTIALQTSVPIDEVDSHLLILRQTEPASVHVDIQTDSTVEIDDFADKEEIIEFITALSGFVQQTPALVQVLGIQASSELLLTMLRKFKLGRDVEQAVMDQIRLVLQQSEQPQEPSPEQIQAQMDMQKMQADYQIKIAELQLKEEQIRIKQAELGLKDQDNKAKIDLEAVKTTIEALDKQAKNDLEKEKIKAEAANPKDNAVVGA
jgi:hypothetical protein